MGIQILFKFQCQVSVFPHSLFVCREKVKKVAWLSLNHDARWGESSSSCSGCFIHWEREPCPLDKGLDRSQGQFEYGGEESITPDLC